jgi:hypothetical protein
VSRAPRTSRLDRETEELLRDDPELLALAEVIASLRPKDIEGQGLRRRRRFDGSRLGRILGAAGRRLRPE